MLGGLLNFMNGGIGAMGCAGGGLCAIGNTVIYLINAVFIPVLFAVAFIVFLYGIAKAYIFSAGEPSKVQDGHKILLWGLLGFVAMLSLWGMVNVLSGTFGLYGSVAPPSPTYYPYAYPSP